MIYQISIVDPNTQTPSDNMQKGDSGVCVCMWERVFVAEDCSWIFI